MFVAHTSAQTHSYEIFTSRYWIGNFKRSRVLMALLSRQRKTIVIFSTANTQNFIQHFWWWKCLHEPYFITKSSSFRECSKKLFSSRESQWNLLHFTLNIWVTIKMKWNVMCDHLETILSSFSIDPYRRIRAKQRI